MNNKGFAISTILYSLLLMAVLILFLLIGVLSFERKSTSDFVNDIKTNLNLQYYKEKEITSSNEIVGAYVRYLNGDYVSINDTINIISKLDSDVPQYSIATSNTTTELVMKNYDKNDSFQQFSIKKSDNKPVIFSIQNPEIAITRVTMSYPILGTTYNSSNTNQRWEIVQSDEYGYYCIKSVANNEECITIDSSNEITTATKVITSECTEGNNSQKFRFEKVKGTK